MLQRAVALLILTASVGICCDCVIPQVRIVQKGSDVIFRGKVLAFQQRQDGQRMVIFSVDRVWKGEVGTTIEMPALERVNCLSFRGGLLEIGNELLVYARKIPALGGDYFTDECSRTELASQSKDYGYLGSGHKPKRR